MGPQLWESRNVEYRSYLKDMLVQSSYFTDHKREAQRSDIMIYPDA